jgi:GNAT superfamily N-acetyltransferase
MARICDEQDSTNCTHGISLSERCGQCMTESMRRYPDMNKPDSPYKIREVSGAEHAATIQAFNALFPDDFLPLKHRHLVAGTFWWLVHFDLAVVGFAGMVPFEPFPRVGYTKRQAVTPAHRGHGLQRRLMEISERKAREATDWTHLVSECSIENVQSANNHFRAGFHLVEAERPWGTETLFWRKRIEKGAL